MKIKLSACLLFLLPVLLLAQVKGTQSHVEDDFSPGLFAIILIAFVGLAATILTITILLLLIVAVAAILVFCGVLSLSVLNGLYHRSFTKGTVLFINLMMALAGSAVGLTISLFAKAIFHLQLSSGNTLLIGLFTGAVIGWLIAKTALRAGRMLVRKFITV